MNHSLEGKKGVQEALAYGELKFKFQLGEMSILSILTCLKMIVFWKKRLVGKILNKEREEEEVVWRKG